MVASVLELATTSPVLALSPYITELIELPASLTALESHMRLFALRETDDARGLVALKDQRVSPFALKPYTIEFLAGKMSMPSGAIDAVANNLRPTTKLYHATEPLLL